MPSNLPRFTIRAEQEIIDKITYIAEENDRSTTQQIVNLIKKEIRDYEEKNGTIFLLVPEEEPDKKTKL